jgi:hypothetical protein
LNRESFHVSRNAKDFHGRALVNNKVKDFTAPNQPKSTIKWGSIHRDTTPFLIVDFRRFRAGQIDLLYCLPVPKLKTVGRTAYHFSIISCAIFRLGKLAHRVKL